MNYVERHFGDWARDTAHLSMLEDGAYNRLCDLYYVREDPLPIDLVACCRLVRATTKSERDAVQSVLSEFFARVPEGWRHKRCDAEIERFRTKSGKASASAKARWKPKQADCEFDANAHANASESHSDVSKLAMPHAGAGGRAPTPHSPLPIYSVPDGTAASAAPMTAKERVWLLGLPLVGEKGRSAIGKLVKTYGEEALLEALVKATLDRPIEPLAWITATCAARAKQKPNGNHAETAEEMLADPRPQWAIDAGFQDRFQAENASCTAHSSHKFRDGKRISE